MRTLGLAFLAFAPGCLIYQGDPGCNHPDSWYPDDDGDGFGEHTAVYHGCNPPDGWVDNADDTGVVAPTDTGA